MPRKHRGLTRAYLARALLAVEGNLDRLYSRYERDDLGHRLTMIAAGTDPDSPVWEDLLQAHYFEKARESLMSALRALHQTHGRTS